MDMTGSQRSPYTSVGATNMPSPQVPGAEGSFPNPSGLSVTNNPVAPQLQGRTDLMGRTGMTSSARPFSPSPAPSMPSPRGPGDYAAPQAPQAPPSSSSSMAPAAAQHTQSFGRGNDSMLVHMTPDEVNSLRGLAQRFGGDLTTNPHTGLPEAGWLGKLLPTLLGGIGMAFGIPPVWMGALGAVGGTAITGDLKQGLMAGLGAFGGASLAGAAGIGGALGNAGASIGLPGAAAAAAPGAVATGAATGAAGAAGAATGAAGAAGAATPGLVATGSGGGLGGILKGFGDAAKQGLGTGVLAKAAPMLAGMGVMNTASNLMTPGAPKAPEAEKSNYNGPYTAPARKSIFDEGYANRTPTGMPGASAMSPYAQPAPGVAPVISRPALDTRERQYFDVVNPIPNAIAAAPKITTPAPTADKKLPNWARGVNPKSTPNWAMSEEDKKKADQYDPSMWDFARGGEINMESGGHVIPAFDVATFGNGSSDAGQQKLAAMGGVPIRGPGDGVSDSIPARIDGEQEARVANGEVYFPPQAVQKLGGNKKLYAMMRNAEKARMRTRSGEPVKMRRA